ncbi:sugar transferase [Roseovarius tibetensis]|uniref:sugar transferase n=1 Tax=Roseovarius tibetensis TaxID=2685897 RepID=UPI003D7F40BE
MAFQDYSEASARRDVAKRRQASRRPALYRNGAKRVLDIMLVVATLPITLPVILVLMALAALDGHNPIYRQGRIGLDGRVFRMLKIRTMVPGADALLERHLDACPEGRREWDETQKLKCDPRITRVGRVLRKCSLDELPQLWNVLTGDMSLVGPRPMMIDQEKLYPGTAYFDLRPGITGPWQISDRNESSFAARAGYDSRYLATLSLTGDVAILFRTMMVVLRGTGY